MGLLAKMGVAQTHLLRRSPVEKFLERYGDRVKHVLSCHDRMVFRGTLRSMCRPEGMLSWLNWQHVLLKDFTPFAKKQSLRLREHAQAFAQRHGRPYEYLKSSRISKQERAQEIAQDDDIREGLVCVFGAREMGMTFDVHSNPKTGRLELRREEQPGTFVYYYFMDREFGLIHVRLQTWLPFDIQVYLNAQDWLARKMDKAGLGYQRWGNCFLRLDHPRHAQELADSMLQTRWPRVLSRFAKLVNPLLGDLLKGRSYYWTVREAEYATDVAFERPQALSEIYPQFVHHAITQFGSEDILRFLGKKLNTQFEGEVEGTLKRRPEGVRVRHQVQENWIKMYDKEGCVLRIETTINNPHRFKAYRKAIRRGERVKDWFPLRKGVADLRRRVEISRKANLAYLDALASVPQRKPTERILDPVSKPVRKGAERFRPLRPIDPDEARIFAGMMRGECLLSGFRNADLRQWLFPQASAEDAKRLAGKVTRRIRLMRAHGLVKKVPKTTRYQVTPRGHAVMGTALNVRRHDVNAFPKTG